MTWVAAFVNCHIPDRSVSAVVRTQLRFFSSSFGLDTVWGPEDMHIIRVLGPCLWQYQEGRALGEAEPCAPASQTCTGGPRVTLARGSGLCPGTPGTHHRSVVLSVVGQIGVSFCSLFTSWAQDRVGRLWDSAILPSASVKLLGPEVFLVGVY